MEISSCSNCHGFQTRRMKDIKIVMVNEFVHTLNVSGLPIGRTIGSNSRKLSKCKMDPISMPNALLPIYGRNEWIEDYEENK